MDIKEIIAKVKSGTELNEEESTFLEKWEPEQGNKIPKSRLDQEIAKRKELEIKLAEQGNLYSELQGKLEAKENEGLSEVEKAQKELEKAQEQLKALEAERDNVNGELAKVNRQNSIHNIGKKFGFSDEEFLDYQISKGNVDLSNDEAVTEFMGSLKESKPGFFVADVNAGGGGTNTTATEPNAKSAKFEAAYNEGNAEKMIQNAPIIYKL